MPPKLTFKPLKFFLSDGKEFIEVKDIREIELSEDVETDEGIRRLSNMAPVSITFRLGSGSNHNRMHGKKAFRLRQYWKCKKHEILSRTISV